LLPSAGNRSSDENNGICKENFRQRKELDNWLRGEGLAWNLSPETTADWLAAKNRGELMEER
jgi:hypothetical protein